MKKQIIPISLPLLIAAMFSCSHQTITQQPGLLSEDQAIQQIAAEINDKSSILKNKKIGVFDFTSVDGSVAPETKRLSTRLLETLIKTTDLSFIERTELDKLLKAQEIEQTGIVDTDTAKSPGGIASIDVMISGTVVIMPGQGEISVKTVNIGSGQIYHMCNAKILAPAGSRTANTTLVKLHRENPEKLDMLNRSYNELKRLGVNKPAVFLLSMADKDDIALINNKNPQAGKFLDKRRVVIAKNNPRLQRKIMLLRKNIPLMKEYAPERYNELISRKKALLENFPMRDK